MFVLSAGSGVVLPVADGAEETGARVAVHVGDGVRLQAQERRPDVRRATAELRQQGARGGRVVGAGEHGGHQKDGAAHERTRGRHHGAQNGPRRDEHARARAAVGPHRAHPFHRRGAAMERMGTTASLLGYSMRVRASAALSGAGSHRRSAPAAAGVYVASQCTSGFVASARSPRRALSRVRDGSAVLYAGGIHRDHC